MPPEGYIPEQTLYIDGNGVLNTRINRLEFNIVGIVENIYYTAFLITNK